MIKLNNATINESKKELEELEQKNSKQLTADVLERQKLKTELEKIQEEEINKLNEKQFHNMLERNGQIHAKVVEYNSLLLDKIIAAGLKFEKIDALRIYHNGEIYQSGGINEPTDDFYEEFEFNNILLDKFKIENFDNMAKIDSDKINSFVNGFLSKEWSFKKETQVANITADSLGFLSSYDGRSILFSVIVKEDMVEVKIDSFIQFLEGYKDNAKCGECGITFVFNI